MKQETQKQAHDYLPHGWPEIIQQEARLAGLRKGTSISNIKKVVYEQNIKHKLWPFVWAHISKGKERETLLEALKSKSAA